MKHSKDLASNRRLQNASLKNEKPLKDQKHAKNQKPQLDPLFKNHKLQVELDLLARILYKSKNQHRNTLYYRKLKHFYKCICKAVKDPSLVPKARDLGLQAYCLLKTLVRQSFFLPFAITAIAAVGRLRKLALDLKEKPLVEPKEQKMHIEQDPFEKEDLDAIFSMLQ